MPLAVDGAPSAAAAAEGGGGSAADGAEEGEEEDARDKEKVQRALEVAKFMARSETYDALHSATGARTTYLEGWEFVSPRALANEYVDQMSSCVSAV